jgi:pimeloyl-ACP methyl ester carboxylesterase
MHRNRSKTGTAVEFILKRHNVSRINLLGWSWGTSIMGWCTAPNNDKVNRLVLYAPQWIRNGGAHRLGRHAPRRIEGRRETLADGWLKAGRA